MRFTDQIVETDPRGRASLGRPERRYLMHEESDGTLVLEPPAVVTKLERRFMAKRSKLRSTTKPGPIRSKGSSDSVGRRRSEQCANWSSIRFRRRSSTACTTSLPDAASM